MFSFSSSLSSSSSSASASTPSISQLLLVVLASSTLFANLTSADCECGYISPIIDDNAPFASTSFLFTDLIESDFLHIRNVSLDTDWRRQEYSVTAAEGRGPYGMNFTVANVLSNPILDLDEWSAEGEFGGPPGLQLVVDAGQLGGYVQVAELDTTREDLLWGSYRAAMQLTLVPGTCSAFFWYFNDSQEIDMEFLSSEFIPENNTYPVNLVLQSVQSAAAGFNAQGTGDYVVANLPFNPTDGFHEYRIDFVPGIVIFYGDGIVLAKMNTSAVPTMPGHLILTQWSNGNPLWSFGPPTTAATITVSYVKAYFNSSDPARQSALAARCKNNGAATGSTCVIPDQYGAPNTSDPRANATAASFFSDDPDKIVNQTVYRKSGASREGGAVTVVPMAMLGLSALVHGLL